MPDLTTLRPVRLAHRRRRRRPASSGSAGRCCARSASARSSASPPGWRGCRSPDRLLHGGRLALCEGGRRARRRIRPVTALLIAGAALLGLLCGFGRRRRPTPRRSWTLGEATRRARTASRHPQLHDRGKTPAVVVGTAVLFGLTAWRFGPGLGTAGLPRARGGRRAAHRHRPAAPAAAQPRGAAGARRRRRAADRRGRGRRRLAGPAAGRASPQWCCSRCSSCSP